MKAASSAAVGRRLGHRASPPSGATLERLPLRPGYYRQNNETTDVRRCPDGASVNVHNCTSDARGNAVCESTSGCQGGAAALCAPGLRGTYCQLCEPREEGRMFYVAASETMVAHCELCGNTLVETAAYFASGALLLLVCVLSGHRLWRRVPRSTRGRSCSRCSTALESGMRICNSFNSGRRRCPLAFTN